MQGSLGIKTWFLSRLTQKLGFFGDVMLRALQRDNEKVFKDVY